jgi:hypothetical protein
MRMARMGGWLAAAAATALTSGAAAGPPAGFNRSAWQDDYSALKAAMEEGYANLAWFASPEGGVDLPAVDRRTEAAIAAASSDEEARLALKNFIASFHDGHLSELPFLAKAGDGPAAEPARLDLARTDAPGACAALGYADRSQVAFSLPFESLQGFALEADGSGTAFRAGRIGVAGRRIGIVRLKNFSRQQYPGECLRAWPGADAATRRDSDAFEKRVTRFWFESLSAQLARFRREGVDAVLVDVGTNSGGDESGDWAARLFTARPVHSAKLLMAAAPPANAYIDEQIAALKGQGSPQALAAAAWFDGRRAVVTGRHCDMSWVWKERRTWGPGPCTRLLGMGWASGAFGYLPPEAATRAAAELVYWPAVVEPWRGSWAGPTYVLTNSASYSAAEMFVAVIKDNGVARTIGTRTGGDGCGFMAEAAPTLLPHSRLRYRMPNCVRLRGDGSNEVAGIEPDLPVAAVEGESPRGRAERLLETLVRDLARAPETLPAPRR